MRDRDLNFTYTTYLEKLNEEGVSAVAYAAKELEADKLLSKVGPCITVYTRHILLYTAGRLLAHVCM